MRANGVSRPSSAALLLPDWTYRFVALLLLIGLPIAIVLAWAFERLETRPQWARGLERAGGAGRGAGPAERGGRRRSRPHDRRDPLAARERDMPEDVIMMRCASWPDHPLFMMAAAASDTAAAECLACDPRFGVIGIVYESGSWERPWILPITHSPLPSRIPE